jgi:hypothetical protein
MCKAMVSAADELALKLNSEMQQSSIKGLAVVRYSPKTLIFYVEISEATCLNADLIDACQAAGMLDGITRHADGFSVIVRPHVLIV